MSAPRKKRKPGRPGRPPGSKDKVKRVRRPRVPKPEPISEDPSPDKYAQHVGALQDIPPEMSYVAKCFGLDQLAGGVIGQPFSDAPCETYAEQDLLRRTQEAIDYIAEERAKKFEEICRIGSEAMVPGASAMEPLSVKEPADMIVVPPGCELTVVPANEIFEGKELRDFAADMATEELKSILRTVSSMMTNLASYPMDHGLRCGMNEIEILLSKNREKFKS